MVRVGRTNKLDGERVLGRVLAVFALILGTLPAVAGNAVLRIGYGDVSSPPFFLGDGTEIPKPAGAAVDLMTAAAKACHLTPVFERWPNKRLFAQAESGMFDMALMFSYSKLREEFFVYPKRNGEPDSDRRMTTLTYSFYVVKGSPVTWDGHALRGFARAVGVNAGWSIGSDLASRGVPIEEAPTTETNFRKLVAGRIDAFAMQDHIGAPYIASHPEDGLIKLQPPISKKDYYAVSTRVWYQNHVADAECLWDQVGHLRTQILPSTVPENASTH